MSLPEGTKITLHWLNGSRAQGTLWLLEELQIPYELKVYHRQKDFRAPPELDEVHPLGKSPVVTITTPSSTKPIVLAESAFVVQYLTEHFGAGKSLAPPKKWKDGQEGQIGGETEEWMRYQYILYYAEGSFMVTAFLYFVMSGLKGNNIPFFIRPITRSIANQITNTLVIPNMNKHFKLLESFLSTSPNDGKYLCGDRLTGADVMLAYGLIGGRGMMVDLAKGDKGSFQESYPNVDAYVQRLSEEPGWKRSAEKIIELEGSYKILP